MKLKAIPLLLLLPALMVVLVGCGGDSQNVATSTPLPETTVTPVLSTSIPTAVNLITSVPYFPESQMW